MTMTAVDGPWIVDLGAGAVPPQTDDVDLLGGKGAGLDRMLANGLNVPPAFVVTTALCRAYLSDGRIPQDLHPDIAAGVTRLEERAGKTFGKGPRPLLLSVRSGAPVSMPGMMDTVLNLGISADVADALYAETRDSRFVADVVGRFHRMYTDVVLGLQPDISEWAAEDVEDEAAAATRGSEIHRIVWTACQSALGHEEGITVPDDPRDQLVGAVEAVVRSWNNPRAITYRDHHKIPHDLGTAVVIQAMVFGNLGELSGTGVLFTRNPTDGSPEMYGEFLQGGQGEDVVSGTVDPEPLAKTQTRLPALVAELRDTGNQLERLYGDMMDIEFTVEQGQLFLLQVRAGKRTPQAAVRIAHDLHAGGTIGLGEALAKLDLDQLRQLARPSFDPVAQEVARRDGSLLATGVGASPGHISGKLVLDPDRAVELAGPQNPVILARTVTSPLDLHGMLASEGILTARGGATSHAAVVARAIGKACVVGCSALEVDGGSQELRVAGRVLRTGEEISLDGTTGEVFAGALPLTTETAVDGGLSALLDAGIDAAGVAILCRAATTAQIAEAVARGADGLTTSIEDVLAAKSLMGPVLGALALELGRQQPDLSRVVQHVRDATRPWLEAAASRPVHVRAIDLRSEHTASLLATQPTLADLPGLKTPLGRVELLRAQIEGLADAADAAGHGGDLCLAVRHVTDPREVDLLERLSAEFDNRVSVRPYADAPRALLLEPRPDAGGVFWLDFDAIQAAMFGILPTELETPEPLDTHVKAGLYRVDPRSGVDRSMSMLLDRLAVALPEGLGIVGVRFTSPASAVIVGDLYDRGVRAFSVNPPELLPLRLAVGQAATAPRDSATKGA